MWRGAGQQLVVFSVVSQSPHKSSASQLGWGQALAVPGGRVQQRVSGLNSRENGGCACRCTPPAAAHLLPLPVCAVSKPPSCKAARRRGAGEGTRAILGCTRWLAARCPPLLTAACKRMATRRAAAAARRLLLLAGLGHEVDAHQREDLATQADAVGAPLRQETSDAS